MPGIKLQKLYGQLRSFGTDRRGNIIITFALALVPILAFVGTAIDYSRASSARAAMQGAVNSVALMLSKDAQTLSTTQLNTKANNYFNAIFNRTEAKNVVITPIFTSPQQGNFKLVVTGTGSVDASAFLKALKNWGIGRDKIDFNVSAEVLWGIKKLEVALALDNTGSMSSSNKMTNLKSAAHSLLDTLKKAAKTDGDVKVAIIPFDTTVNLGTSYKDNANWFDVDAIDCNGWRSGSGCNSNNWKSYWEGCVRDRTYPYDAQDDSPTSTSAARFPVSDCGELTKLMPLTSNWDNLNDKIDDMSPNGNTNVTIGLAWAWHALTTGQPLTQAAAPSPDLDKVIILLTDGDNTESWKNSNNTKVTSQNSIDDRTTLLCNNIRNTTSIRVYTVRVIDGNADLLRDCATNPSMYFDVQQASQLNSVFSAIAQNLANLRLAK